MFYYYVIWAVLCDVLFTVLCVLLCTVLCTVMCAVLCAVLCTVLFGVMCDVLCFVLFPVLCAIRQKTKTVLVDSWLQATQLDSHWMSSDCQLLTHTVTVLSE